LKTNMAQLFLDLTTNLKGGDARRGTRIVSTHKPYSLTMAAPEMRVLANRDLAGETQGSAFFSLNKLFHKNNTYT
jgi:hypothetical protein